MLEELKNEYYLNDFQTEKLEAFYNRMNPNLTDEDIKWILSCVIEDFIIEYLE